MKDKGKSASVEDTLGDFLSQLRYFMWRRLSILLALVIFVLTAALGLWTTSTRVQLQHRESLLLLQDTSSVWQNRITARFSQAISLSLTLGAFAASYANKSVAFNESIASRTDLVNPIAFDMLCESLFSLVPGLLSLQLQSHGILSQAYPNGSAPIGADVAALPIPLQGILTAIYLARPVVVGPIDLLQGGYGIFARFPVFIRKPKVLQNFWGMGTVVARVTELLDAMNVSDIHHMYGFDYVCWVQPKVNPQQAFAVLAHAESVGGISKASSAVRQRCGGGSGRTEAAVSSATIGCVRWRLPLDDNTTDTFFAIYPGQGLPPEDTSIMFRVGVAVGALTLGVSSLILTNGLMYASFLCRHQRAITGKRSKEFLLVVLGYRMPEIQARLARLQQWPRVCCFLQHHLSSSSSASFASSTQSQRHRGWLSSTSTGMSSVSSDSNSSDIIAPMQPESRPPLREGAAGVPSSSLKPSRGSRNYSCRYALRSCFNRLAQAASRASIFNRKITREVCPATTIGAVALRGHFTLIERGAENAAAQLLEQFNAFVASVALQHGCYVSAPIGSTCLTIVASSPLALWTCAHALLQGAAVALRVAPNVLRNDADDVDWTSTPTTSTTSSSGGDRATFNGHASKTKLQKKGSSARNHAPRRKSSLSPLPQKQKEDDDEDSSRQGHQAHMAVACHYGASVRIFNVTTDCYVYAGPIIAALAEAVDATRAGELSCTTHFGLAAMREGQSASRRSVDKITTSRRSSTSNNKDPPAPLAFFLAVFTNLLSVDDAANAATSSSSTDTATLTPISCGGGHDEDDGRQLSSTSAAAALLPFEDASMLMGHSDADTIRPFIEVFVASGDLQPPEDDDALPPLDTSVTASINVSHSASRGGWMSGGGGESVQSAGSACQRVYWHSLNNASLHNAQSVLEDIFLTAAGGPQQGAVVESSGADDDDDDDDEEEISEGGDGRTGRSVATVTAPKPTKIKEERPKSLHLFLFFRSLLRMFPAFLLSWKIKNHPHHHMHRHDDRDRQQHPPVFDATPLSPMKPLPLLYDLDDNNAVAELLTSSHWMRLLRVANGVQFEVVIEAKNEEKKKGEEVPAPRMETNVAGNEGVVAMRTNKKVASGRQTGDGERHNPAEHTPTSSTQVQFGTKKNIVGTNPVKYMDTLTHQTVVFHRKLQLFSLHCGRAHSVCSSSSFLHSSHSSASVSSSASTSLSSRPLASLPLSLITPDEGGTNPTYKSIYKGDTGGSSAGGVVTDSPTTNEEDKEQDCSGPKTVVPVVLMSEQKHLLSQQHQLLLSSSSLASPVFATTKCASSLPSGGHVEGIIARTAANTATPTTVESSDVFMGKQFDKKDCDCDGDDDDEHQRVFFIQASENTEEEEVASDEMSPPMVGPSGAVQKQQQQQQQLEQEQEQQSSSLRLFTSNATSASTSSTPTAHTDSTTTNAERRHVQFKQVKRSGGSGIPPHRGGRGGGGEGYSSPTSESESENNDTERKQLGGGSVAHRRGGDGRGRKSSSSSSSSRSGGGSGFSSRHQYCGQGLGPTFLSRTAALLTIRVYIPHVPPPPPRSQTLLSQKELNNRRAPGSNNHHGRLTAAKPPSSVSDATTVPLPHSGFRLIQSTHAALLRLVELVAAVASEHRGIVVSVSDRTTTPTAAPTMTTTEMTAKSTRTASSPSPSPLPATTTNDPAVYRVVEMAVAFNFLDSATLAVARAMNVGILLAASPAPTAAQPAAVTTTPLQQQQQQHTHPLSPAASLLLTQPQQQSQRISTTPPTTPPQTPTTTRGTSAALSSSSSSSTFYAGSSMDAPFALAAVTAGRLCGIVCEKGGTLLLGEPVADAANMLDTALAARRIRCCNRGIASSSFTSIQINNNNQHAQTTHLGGASASAIVVVSVAATVDDCPSDVFPSVKQTAFVEPPSSSPHHSHQALTSSPSNSTTNATATATAPTPNTTTAATTIPGVPDSPVRVITSLAATNTGTNDTAATTSRSNNDADTEVLCEEDAPSGTLQLRPPLPLPLPQPVPVPVPVSVVCGGLNIHPICPFTRTSCASSFSTSSSSSSVMLLARLNAPGMEAIGSLLCASYCDWSSASSSSSLRHAKEDCEVTDPEDVEETFNGRGGVSSKDNESFIRNNNTQRLSPSSSTPTATTAAASSQTASRAVCPRCDGLEACWRAPDACFSVHAFDILGPHYFEAAICTTTTTTTTGRRDQQQLQTRDTTALITSPISQRRLRRLLAVEFSSSSGLRHGESGPTTSSSVYGPTATQAAQQRLQLHLMKFIFGDAYGGILVRAKRYVARGGHGYIPIWPPHQALNYNNNHNRAGADHDCGGSCSDNASNASSTYQNSNPTNPACLQQQQQQRPQCFLVMAPEVSAAGMSLPPEAGGERALLPQQLERLQRVLTSASSTVTKTVTTASSYSC